MDTITERMNAFQIESKESSCINSITRCLPDVLNITTGWDLYRSLFNYEPNLLVNSRYSNGIYYTKFNIKYLTKFRHFIDYINYSPYSKFTIVYQGDYDNNTFYNCHYEIIFIPN